MKTKLDQLYQTKKKQITRLTKINTNLLIKAYDGLIKKKSIKEIHRDIRRILVKNDCYDKYVEAYVRKVVKKGKRKDVEDLFNDSLLLGLNSIIFEKARKEESKVKDEILKDTLTKNRWDLKHNVFDNETISKAKIFYLASAHMDSAKDHVDYQGKLYVDENWASMLNDYPKTKKMVSEFIESKNINTFQWVTGSPVWFITRPNCRHYFKSISIETALNNPVSDLLKRYNMIHKSGYDRMKPIKLPSGAEYSKENIEDIISKYQDRLTYHEGLYNVNKTDAMKKYIDKDKFLINKWKSYLRKK